MKRISQNRDLFEASAGETITVTLEASKTPFQGTFSELGSGGKWTSVQIPTPAQPVEKRKFTMPENTREFFDIVCAFPPQDQMNPDAKYRLSFSSGGTVDGPNDVLPPFVGDINDLFCEFRLPGTVPGTVLSLMTPPEKSGPPKASKKKAAKSKGTAGKRS